MYYKKHTFKHIQTHPQFLWDAQINEKADSKWASKYQDAHTLKIIL